MIYLRKSKKGGKKIIFISSLVILFLVLAFFLMSRTPDSLATVTRSVGFPIWKARNFFVDETKDTFNFFRSHNALITENKRLKEENDTLRSTLLGLDTLKSEHEKLLADFGRSTIEKKVLASVLVRPPQTPYDTLILDVGSDNGIIPGNIFYSMSGFALGTINDVTKRTSKAILFSSTDVEVEGLVERSGFPINLRGKGGGIFEVQAPQDADILKDDVVIMPTLRGSIIGFVADIESSVTSAFRRVLVQIPINVSHLRFVQVEI